MTASSTLLALFLMPLCLWVYSRHWINTALVQLLPLGAVSLTLGSTLLPIGLGVLIRYRHPRAADLLVKVGTPRRGGRGGHIGNGEGGPGGAVVEGSGGSERERQGKGRGCRLSPRGEAAPCPCCTWGWGSPPRAQPRSLRPCRQNDLAAKGTGSTSPLL